MKNQVMLDSKGRKINAVMTFGNSELDKMNQAYIFTKNPYLHMKSQHIALITISWIACIDMLIIQSRTRESRDKMIMTASNMLLLMERYVKRMFTGHEVMTNIIKQIIEKEHFNEYLTETHDIVSICRLFGALTIEEAKPIFTTDKFKILSRELMAEAVMRYCRVCVKQSLSNEYKILCDLLGINEDIDLDSYVFDINCVNQTNKFFRSSYSNCSPFVVVATLGILKYIHNNVGTTATKNLIFLDKNLRFLSRNIKFLLTLHRVAQYLF